MTADTSCRARILDLFLGHAVAVYLGTLHVGRSPPAHPHRLGRPARPQTPDRRPDLRPRNERLPASSGSARSRARRTPRARAVADFLDLGDHPDHVRGTLRDVPLYLAVDLLTDTSHWRPEHSSASSTASIPRQPPLRPARPVSRGRPRRRLAPPDCPARAPCSPTSSAGTPAAGRDDAALEARVDPRLAASTRLHRPRRPPHPRARPPRPASRPLRRSQRLLGQRPVPSSSRLRRAARRSSAQAHRLASRRPRRPRLDPHRRRTPAGIHDPPDRSPRLRHPDHAVSTAPTGYSISSATRTSAPFTSAPSPSTSTHRALTHRRLSHPLPAWNEWNRPPLAGAPPGGSARNKPAAEWKVALAATPDYQHHAPTSPRRLPSTASTSWSPRSTPTSPTATATASWPPTSSSATWSILADGNHRGEPEVVVLDGDRRRPRRRRRGRLCPQRVAARQTPGRHRRQRRHRRPRRGPLPPATPRPAATTSCSPARATELAFHTAGLYLHAEHTSAAPPPASYTDRSIYRPEQTLHCKIVVYSADDDQHPLSGPPRPAPRGPPCRPQPRGRRDAPASPPTPTAPPPASLRSPQVACSAPGSSSATDVRPATSPRRGVQAPHLRTPLAPTRAARSASTSPATSAARPATTSASPSPAPASATASSASPSPRRGGGARRRRQVPPNASPSARPRLPTTAPSRSRFSAHVDPRKAKSPGIRPRLQRHPCRAHRRRRRDPHATRIIRLGFTYIEATVSLAVELSPSADRPLALTVRAPT